MAEETGAWERERASAQTITETMDAISDVVQQMTSAADVSAAFGDPQTVGERTVIPAAEVLCVFGLGMGSGVAPEGGRGSTGAGGGAGGVTRAHPVAVIVVEPRGVSVQPVLDVTQVSLAGISAGIFFLFWIGRLLWKGASADGAGGLHGTRRLGKLLRKP